MNTCDDSGQGCCPDKADCISDHCDGRFEPGSEKSDEVEQHLATCTRCAEALEDYKALSAAAKVLKETDCAHLDVQQLKQAVNSGLRRVVFMHRLTWGGALFTAVAAVAAAVVAVLMPPTPDRTPDVVVKAVPDARTAPVTPAVDTDREALIQQIIADLKAEPRDLADERVRNDMKRRLRAAGLVVDGPDPDKWIAVEGDTPLSGPVLELRTLIREMERSRSSRGVIKVDGSTR